MDAYERALEALHQAPLAEFVATRRRLQAELRTQGERDAAARLAKRRRPGISAWAVNQLYWHARRDFDAMLAAAARLRAGDLAAREEHRRAMATLRRRAAAILKEGDHAASAAVLGRVTGTLAAIAASGFEPDRPGTLTSERDPPGFEIGWVPRPRRAATGKKPAAAARAAESVKQTPAARAAEPPVTRPAAAERVHEAGERRRREREVAGARAELERRGQALARLRAQVAAAERSVEEARTRLRALQRTVTTTGS